MKKKMLGLGFLLLLLSILLLNGCDSPELVYTEDNNNQIKIGFSMATLLEDRWLRDRDIFISKAKEKDMEVIISNANMDSDVQYQQVLDLISQNIDVLVIAPNDSEKDARCVEAAKKQNIPVIIYDRLIHNTKADVYITFDNYMVGNLMGEYMLEHSPSGGYLLINGPKTDNNCLMIQEGYMDVLQPSIDSGKIWIMGETWTDDWKQENAYDYVNKHFAEFNEIPVAAICANDSLARGVIDAFTERKIENVGVVGMDADLLACQRIVSGRQGMTIYKPIQNLVGETLHVCEILANGEALETDQVIDDGSSEIPYIAIDVYAVTLDTMDETIIADGFHLAEDVYSNQ